MDETSTSYIKRSQNQGSNKKQKKKYKDSQKI